MSKIYTFNTESAIKFKAIDIKFLSMYITNNQQLSLLGVLVKLRLLESCPRALPVRSAE